MAITCGNCHRSHSTVDEVRECHQLFPQAPPVEERQPREEITRSGKPGPHPEPVCGTYTFIWGDGDLYKTVRIQPWRNRPGVVTLEFLVGPDNSLDFQAFGNWENGRYQIWRRYKSNREMAEIVEWLSASDEDKRNAAGELYALRSTRCRRCNKKLTVPSSIYAGYGPDCAGKV